jgi:hypothetical protein
MKERTRRTLRGMLEAVGVLTVLALGALVLLYALNACTFVTIRDSEHVSFEQVGGHNGWTIERADETTPSVRERIIGQHASGSSAPRDSALTDNNKKSPR